MNSDTDMLAPTEVMRRAASCAAVIFHALLRDKQPNTPSVSFYELDKGDQPVLRTIVWDFTDAANLEIVDERIIPVALDIYAEAQERGITAALQYFEPQVRYAMDIGSVSKLDFAEINSILHPPEPRTPATVLEFPSRHR